MTDEWKATVAARLEAMGKDRAWLAREMGVPDSTVKRMLEAQHASAHVMQVCEILGIPQPKIGVTASWVEQAVRDLGDLSDEDREMALTYIRRLKRG